MIEDLSHLGLLKYRPNVSELYEGKVLDTVLNMFSAVLKVIRWSAGNQWRSVSRGVAWEYFGFIWISQGALFWSFCGRLRLCCGKKRVAVVKA